MVKKIHIKSLVATPEQQAIEHEFMGMLSCVVDELQDQYHSGQLKRSEVDPALQERMAVPMVFALHKLGLHWMAEALCKTYGLDLRDGVEFSPDGRPSEEHIAEMRAQRDGDNVVPGPKEWFH